MKVNFVNMQKIAKLQRFWIVYYTNLQKSNDIL